MVLLEYFDVGLYSSGTPLKNLFEKTKPVHIKLGEKFCSLQVWLHCILTSKRKEKLYSSKKPKFHVSCIVWNDNIQYIFIMH